MSTHPEMLAGRIRKNLRRWRKWIKRDSVQCLRLYDRDIPEIPLSIDKYGAHLVVYMWDGVDGRTRSERQIWRNELGDAAADVCSVPRDAVFHKVRRRTHRGGQYERLDRAGVEAVVEEGGLKFRVNLSDYLDTGLFLDHRQTRAMVRERSEGKRVLNLFAYTGAFSVYAAAGGANSTVSVDRSGHYLDRARANLVLNGFGESQHHTVRADVRPFVAEQRKQGRSYDILVVDPPTYSTSGDRNDTAEWDVQRDHAELLNSLIPLMATEGEIWFSTNHRRFVLDEAALELGFAELTDRTTPPDFQRHPLHRCFLLTRTT